MENNFSEISTEELKTRLEQLSIQIKIKRENILKEADILESNIQEYLSINTVLEKREC